MKQLIQATLSIGLVLGSISSADACCLWPFGGWWGAGYSGAPAYGSYSAGYSGAPAYGSYSAGYPSWSQPAYGSYYSAGYASAADCCTPSCCNPCTSGSCTSGSCAGVTTSGTGTLKPANDSNFKDGTQKSDYEKGLNRDRVKSPADDTLEFDSPARSKTNEPDPNDDFRASPMDGTDRGTDIPFGLDGDQIKNKPPMPDPSDLPAVEPGDGSTFLDGEKKASDNQSRIERRQKILAERSSGLGEVITPKRLASRSLPSSGTRSPSAWAGKSNDDQGPSANPVRWISVPMPDGQVRL